MGDMADYYREQRKMAELFEFEQQDGDEEQIEVIRKNKLYPRYHLQITHKEPNQMNKFYSTMSPNDARHILRATLEEAVQEASDRTASDGRIRYVVQIVRKIEPAQAPVKVSVVK